MTETYEMRTDSHDYQYPTLDALVADLNRFESDATVSVYAYTGGPYDEAPTSAHQYHFEQDYMALATAALGGR